MLVAGGGRIESQHSIYRRDPVVVRKGEEYITLYGLSLRVQGFELQVWDKCGTELLGLYGLEFARNLPHCWQRKELFQSVIESERLMIAQRLIRR